MASSVEQLTKYVTQRYEEKEAYEEAEKKRTERDRAIDSAPQKTTTEFYCKTHGDFKADANKIVQSDWTVKNQRLAFYQPMPYSEALYWQNGEPSWDRPSGCCKSCVRRITDKQQDPYYIQSEMLKQQRIEQADDFLQPGDPRFAQVYGDPFKKYNDELERQERAKYELNKRRI